MPTHARVTTMLPVKDLARARRFYETCLGLEAGHVKPDGKLEYVVPGFKTVEHVCVLGAEKAAWFKGTEWNVLCLHEELA